MQPQRQMTGVALEVRVRGKDGRRDSFGDRAEEKIDGRALDPAGSAGIETLSGANVVGRENWFVSEIRESLLETPKMRGIRDPRENLLANDPEKSDPALLNQSGPLLHEEDLSGRKALRFSTKSKRPDCRVYEDPHRRRRSFL